MARETGLYYAECAPKTPSPLAQSQGEAAWLWRVSEEIVGDLNKDNNNNNRGFYYLSDGVLYKSPWFTGTINYFVIEDICPLSTPKH